MLKHGNTETLTAEVESLILLRKGYGATRKLSRLGETGKTETQKN